MKVGDLVCTLDNWDRIGIIVEVYSCQNWPLEAKIKWTTGTVECWCVKELVVL